MLNLQACLARITFLYRYVISIETALYIFSLMELIKLARVWNTWLRVYMEIQKKLAVRSRDLNT